jgi:hypothetical protein
VELYTSVRTSVLHSACFIGKIAGGILKNLDLHIFLYDTSLGYINLAEIRNVIVRVKQVSGNVRGEGKVVTLSAMEDYIPSSVLSEPRHEMKKYGQIHTSTNLTQGRELPASIGWEAGWTSAPVCMLEETDLCLVHAGNWAPAYSTTETHLLYL